MLLCYIFSPTYMNHYYSKLFSNYINIQLLFQIQKHIAESYAEYMAGRAYVYQVASQIDLSQAGNGLDADGVKLYCAPMAKRIADRAMQVLGGNGYISSYIVERLWRDSKLLEIGGGTNEAHHKNMVRDISKKGLSIT